MGRLQSPLEDQKYSPTGVQMSPDAIRRDFGPRLSSQTKGEARRLTLTMAGSI